MVAFVPAPRDEFRAAEIRSELGAAFPVVTSVRVLAEVLLATLLVALAWETPLRERAAAVVPALAKPAPEARRQPNAPAEEVHVVAAEQPTVPSQPRQPPAAAPIAASTSSASGNWMWDPKRPASLDRPSQSATPAVFTKHIYYEDGNGKKYWLDAQGKRHYEP